MCDCVDDGSVTGGLTAEQVREVAEALEHPGYLLEEDQPWRGGGVEPGELWRG